MTAPRLAAAKLVRLNRRTRLQVSAVAVLLCLGMLIALFWAERDFFNPALKWLRLHGLLCAILAAIASAVLIARRRALKRAEYARSWLAAVPVRVGAARWESLAIETLPALAAMGLLAVLSVACSLVLAFAARADILTPLAIGAYLCGGIAAGIVGSYLVPQPKPVVLPPGSRYVPHQKVRRAAGIQPSLRALGAWPARQMFAWAQPKIVSRALIPILVMMPMGTTADAAMVVIAMFATFSALLLLWSAVILASRAARSWLAPLPARRGVVIRAFLLPTCALIVAAGATEALLLLVFNVSYRTSALLGICTAVIGCLTAGGALAWNLRQDRAP
ncbi:MAG TPA: hypothetical protein VHS76_16420 [Steroidobacteraceae bacterium]|nr:hypothetical protein [Steroidobacteraceae bacterium]